MVAAWKRRRFTVDQYYEMARAGILGPDDRVELLDGEVVEKMPIGSEHAGCVEYLAWQFNRALGDDALVRTQNPIHLSRYSEPEPDLAIVRFRADLYRRDHPTVADVLLLIEVSDSSVARDRVLKLPLYAAAGITEVWIVDLPAARLRVFRGPGPDGYATTLDLTCGAVVTPVAFPHLELAVTDILG